MVCMRTLSFRQPYAELIPSTYSGQALRGDQDGLRRAQSSRGAAVTLDEDRGGTLLHLRIQGFRGQGSGFREDLVLRSFGSRESARVDDRAGGAGEADRARVAPRCAAADGGDRPRPRPLSAPVVQPYAPPNCVPIAWTCEVQKWIKVLRVPVGGQAVARGEGREASTYRGSPVRSCPQCPDIFIDGTTCAV
jgi:hypothetical protein